MSRYECAGCGEILDTFDAAAKHVADHNVSELTTEIPEDANV